MEDFKNDEDNRGRRQYVRAIDRIPIYYEVSSAGAEDVHDSTDIDLLTTDDQNDEDNPRIYELLFNINQKLDILISHLTDNTGFNMPEAREVSIGGGGMGFNCLESFEPGTILIIKTFLPVFSRGIRLKCEVVRSEPIADGGFSVAVRFVDLDEATREKIIRYIFAKQRKELRTEKEDLKRTMNH